MLKPDPIQAHVPHPHVRYISKMAGSMSGREILPVSSSYESPSLSVKNRSNAYTSYA